MAFARVGMALRSFSTSRASCQLIQPPIQVFGTEGRYAMALYSAAMKKNSLDVVEKDLVDFSSLMKSDGKLKDFLKNPLLSKDLKKAAVESVMTKKKANPVTANFFALMAENGRLADTEAVLKAFHTIMSAVRGEVACEVTTAKPLDASTQSELESALKSFLKKGEKIILTTKVDPSLIGGMVVSIGDKYVDMSIVTKISKYTQIIKGAV